ncbi:hypothetical protein [Scleromatobacter humisilvae]|uniref:Uncharacterized protein n=1 Tax=Scleromatobacter humisilvae TaxID=2897159 RepID=A0A9X1YKX5_9BURK|nr:hypothetical protein [Scleromatobacter humisilvae]MCK9687345.1 hypothetical protein [Scleromatobacter humisilvae]
MATWLRDFKPTRSQPRLWVETIWLVESREPLVITRTIELHPGLNIVWAKESASNEASGLSSAGHGVGKTSLCLLLRYVLGDDAPANATLRAKAAGSFPKGGVAAKVHVDGVVWLVFRPYGLYSHSTAAQCESLDELLQVTVANDFGGYSNALEEFSIGRLAARSLPGTNQPLEWRHLMAWCIREQRTRFDGFYHWREGEGLGFKRSRRDPPLLVASVLGLVDVGLDRLLRDIEAKQKAVEQFKERIPELERAPIFELARAERQLRLRARAEEDEPVFASTVGESVESRVQAAILAMEQDERRWDSSVEQAEDALAAEQVRLHGLTRARELAELEAGIAKSLVDANQADFERLTKLRDKLEGLDGRCDHGNVEFGECQHIQERKSSVNITWHHDARQAKAAAPELAERYVTRKGAYEEAAKAVTDQALRISEKRAELRRLRVRVATSESARAFLKQSWDELQLLHTQRANGGDTTELVEARKRLLEFETELNSLRAAEVAQSAQQSSRVDAIRALTSAVSERLLGAAGHARFVPGHEVRPFEVARGGEAYQVLEVLLGDIVCLLDSVVSEASSHPGFLVHDCPREADMSERLYREFFLAAAEAGDQLGGGGGVPFQFIVTTTSPPPIELQGEGTVVLELEPGVEGSLLFRRELMPTLPGFELE